MTPFIQGLTPFTGWHRRPRLPRRRNEPCFAHVLLCALRIAPANLRCAPMQPIDKANALIEALPYLQAFRGKTFLIKMGGSAMENPELVAKVMRDIVFLEVAGINPIVVHGGRNMKRPVLDVKGAFTSPLPCRSRRR